MRNFLSDINVMFLWKKKHSMNETKSNDVSGKISTWKKTLKIEKNGIGGAIISNRLGTTCDERECTELIDNIELVFCDAARFDYERIDNFVESKR